MTTIIVQFQHRKKGLFQRRYHQFRLFRGLLLIPPLLLYRKRPQIGSSDDESNYLYSFSSSVDVGLMTILTMMIIPTILIIILIILPMMLLVVPDVTGTQKEQDVFSNTNTKRPTTVSMTISSDASPSSTSPHESRKRKELHLQQQQFWAFIQKLHYSHISSCCYGFKWITAILYKLSMTIWTLLQFHNDSVCSLASAWQLLLGVLQ